MRLLALSTALLLSLSSPAVAKIGDCGQPRTDGDSPTVADALHILVASLHGRDCPVGTCDVNADCRVTSRDALHTFRHAIRLEDALACSSACPGEPERCGESEAPICGGECPVGYECRPHECEAKVRICHVPPGNPANQHTISVDASAVPAHLAHGDYLGRCRDCDSDRRAKKQKHGKGHKPKKDRDHKKKKDHDRRSDQECRCDRVDEPTTTTSSTTSTSTSTSTTSSTSISVTSTTNTTTTITLPSGDEDNDGIGDETDPCLADARNLCAGTVAVDGTTGNAIRINAGVIGAVCSGVKIDCTGTTWNADFGYNQADSATACAGCAISGVTALFGCTDEQTQDLFRCEHWDPAPLPDLGYSFDVPDGSYVVNLFFANTFAGTATVGSRVMNLLIEDETVYAGFDQVAAAAGATQAAVVRSAIVTVDDGNGLQIFFDHVIENPSVKAIEVLTVTAP